MILVTGATGIVGRPLVDLLASQGAKVRAVSRSPQAAGLPVGVEVVAGDPSRPQTLVPFLGDVTALFLHPRAAGLAAVWSSPLRRARRTAEACAVRPASIASRCRWLPSASLAPRTVLPSSRTGINPGGSSWPAASSWTGGSPGSLLIS